MSTIQVVDGTMIKNGFANLFSLSNLADTLRAQHAISRRVITVPLTDGGVAATGVAESAVYTNPMGVPTNGITGVSNCVKLVAAYIICPVAMTLNAGNFVTFAVFTRLATGLTQTALASFATSATTTVAFAPNALTFAAFTTLNPGAAVGDVLTVSAVKSGTGVAFAAATAQAFLQLVVEEF